MTKPIAGDSADIALHGGLELPVFTTLRHTDTNVDVDDSDSNDATYEHESDRVDDLLDGGEHWDDIPRARARRMARAQQGSASAAPLPSNVMLQYVEEQGFQRPPGGRRVR